MIMDCSQYVGPCACGKDHELETKMVVVEYGALSRFEEYMAAAGLAGKRRAVVYDSNIYALTEGKADAVLAASLFHFGEIPIPALKEYLNQRGISVRISNS